MIYYIILYYIILYLNYNILNFKTIHSMNNNLIESIDLLRKNKRYFVNQEDYIKILTNLYNEISEKNLNNNANNFNNIKKNIKDDKLDKDQDDKLNKDQDDKFDKDQDDKFDKDQDDKLELDEDDKLELFENIKSKNNFNEILKIKNFKKLSSINKLFELLLIENNLIQFDSDTNYEIQTIAICNKYDIQNIVNLIKVLLHICDTVKDYKNKVIIFIIIFDLIFKNFKFVIDHINFGITVKNKLNEFENHIDKINEVCKKYNLEKDILFKWSHEMNLIK
jgi:hypothetical protein